MPNVILQNCVCLGGVGYPIVPGMEYDLTLSESEVVFHTSRDSSHSIPLIEVCSLDITGPGTVTTGGGFIGGGFGVEGALTGVAIASILNALTTKSKIHTFISFITNIGELHFHYSGMEPSALRIALASVFTTLRRLDPAWQQARLATLEFERKYRGLPDHEFDRLLSRIVQLPPQPQATTGRCPSCSAIIPFKSIKCCECGAIFSADSDWQVIPIFDSAACN